MAEVTYEFEAPDSDLAKQLLTKYFAELASRFPEGFDVEQSVAAPVEELRPPTGTFLVAQIDGEPAGCGAVRLLDSKTAEVKRMWVSPLVRGRGVGKGLLSALESAANELGATAIRLDTSAHLPEAKAMYERTGYVEISAYNDNSYAAHWFEKVLDLS